MDRIVGKKICNEALCEDGGDKQSDGLDFRYAQFECLEFGKYSSASKMSVGNEPPNACISNYYSVTVREGKKNCVASISWPSPAS